MPHPAEWKLDAPAGPIIVDVDLTGDDPPSQSHLSRSVTRPHASRQSVLGAVGDLDGFVLIIEGEGGQHRTKDLLLRNG